ncbi:MAG: invasion associated locus B family protein [Methylocystis sp.]
MKAPKRLTIVGGVAIYLGLTGAGLALAGAALAQTGSPKAAAPAEKAVPKEPSTQTTSATFGDWTLRCQTTPAPQSRRSCEIVQNVMIQNQTAPFAMIAFGKPTPDDSLHVTVVVPVNVTFPSSVRIALDEKDPQPAELSWARCLPAGCFASAVPKEEGLKKWRTTAGPGRVTFKSASGQDVAMQISFRGLPQALDALAKER